MPPTRQPLSQPPLPANVLLILAALTEGPAHGYRIRQDVLRRSDHTARLDPGTLYRLIARLLEDGLIAEATAPPRADRDDARRKYYALTPRGRQVLAAEVGRLENLLAGLRLTTGRRRLRHT
jgi:DNA-binding PadR family transcriptional regulator